MSSTNIIREEENYNNFIDTIIYQKNSINIPADVSYCLYSEIEMFGGTSGDINYFLRQSKFDVTELFDRMEKNRSEVSESLLNNIEIEMQNWYINIATDMEKSVLFYRFLFDLEFQLKEWKTSLFEYLSELNIKIDRRINFDTLKKQIMNTQNITEENEYLEFFSLSPNAIKNRALKKIKILFEFLKSVEYKFNFYQKNLKYTLDEVMIIICKQDESASQMIINNISSSFEETLGLIETKNTKIKKKEEKQNKKLIRRMLNKSIETFNTFLPKKDLNCFISGGSFRIEGTHFDYEISQKKQYKLLQKPSDTTSSHIPYMLDLYNKKNEYLANLCITFNGCPILDQILSVYLMISSGQEEEMLDKCNFYKTSDNFIEDKTVKLLLSERFNKKIDNKIDLRNLVNNVSFNESILNMTKAEKRKVSDFIDKKIFSKIFDENIFEFIFKREVSWDELKDYYSIGRNGRIDLEFGRGGVFTDKRLNYLVNN